MQFEIEQPWTTERWLGEDAVGPDRLTVAREEIDRLMPVLDRDLAAIRARNEQLLPYVAEAHRRTLAVDVGLDRFVAGDPA